MRGNKASTNGRTVRTIRCNCLLRFDDSVVTGGLGHVEYRFWIHFIQMRFSTTSIEIYRTLLSISHFLGGLGVEGETTVTERIGIVGQKNDHGREGVPIPLAMKNYVDIVHRPRVLKLRSSWFSGRRFGILYDL
jgi:hypothetical protein